MLGIVGLGIIILCLYCYGMIGFMTGMVTMMICECELEWERYFAAGVYAGLLWPIAIPVMCWFGLKHFLKWFPKAMAGKGHDDV